MIIPKIWNSVRTRITQVWSRRPSLSNLKTHQIMSVISMLLGLSFFFEKYQLVSRALATPFSLLDWPWLPLSGQHTWGVAFFFGGLAIMLKISIYVRAIALIFGAASWGIFMSAALYEAFIAQNASQTGAFAGLMCAMALLGFLRALANLTPDYGDRRRG